MLTAPMLFALASGRDQCEDATHACFYCGAGCNSEFSVREFVAANSFTGWSDIACPRSPFVCVGCSLVTKDAAIRGKTLQPRLFSWLLTRESITPLNKGDVPLIRAALLSPPSAPWAFAVSTSGQKHLLYRTPVNLSDSPPFRVRCELDEVTYSPDQLREWLGVAGTIANVIGKIALAEPIEGRQFIALADQRGIETTEQVVARWQSIQSTPFGRLISFVVPSKKETQDARDAACGATVSA